MPDGRSLVIRSWDPDLALAVDSAKMEQLLSRIDPALLLALLRSHPGEPFTVTAGEEIDLLWLGPLRLACTQAGPV